VRRSALQKYEHRTPSDFATFNLPASLNFTTAFGHDLPTSSAWVLGT
jgi:hypothetical protein